VRLGDGMAGEPLRGCTLGRGIGRTGGRVRTLTSEPHLGTTTSMTRPNDAYVIQPLYVLPRDGKDNGLATDGTISRSVAAMQSWFAGQTGGRRLRILAGTVATVGLVRPKPRSQRQGGTYAIEWKSCCRTRDTPTRTGSMPFGMTGPAPRAAAGAPGHRS
jgi:hypothetical protein